MTTTSKLAISIPSNLAHAMSKKSFGQKDFHEGSFLDAVKSIIIAVISFLFSFILAILGVQAPHETITSSEHVSDSESTSSSSSFASSSSTTITSNATMREDGHEHNHDGISRSSSSYLGSIPRGAPEDILEIFEAFKKCTDPNKVNVCIGAYRDENGRPWVLPSVHKAETVMINDPDRNKEYSGVIGDTAYIAQAMKFAYGHDFVRQGTAVGVQTLSGTGACRLGAEFLGQFAPVKKIFVPDPTWSNHIAIFESCGLEVLRYRYYNRATNGLDFNGMMEDINASPDHAIILLHACAHNPTGCDPSRDQWKEISDACMRKRHQVFFDCAYQGFASGNPEEDAFAIRYFANRGVHDAMMVAQSFSKNFGLYGERCGTLSIVLTGVVDDEQLHDHKERVLSQLKSTIRPMYSTPPIHGSNIVKTILEDAELTEQYYKECALMAKRAISMRGVLIDNLKEAGSIHDWSHIGKQKGMFAFTGMSSAMCEKLTDSYSIFITLDGRISLTGLNESNVGYVAKAIHMVTDGKSITSIAT